MVAGIHILINACFTFSLMHASLKEKKRSMYANCEDGVFNAVKF